MGWGCRARTNFNALELMCSMPDDAQVILDAMREGKGQREAARQHMGGGGRLALVLCSHLTDKSWRYSWCTLLKSRHQSTLSSMTGTAEGKVINPTENLKLAEQPLS